MGAQNSGTLTLELLEQATRRDRQSFSGELVRMALGKREGATLTSVTDVQAASRRGQIKRICAVARQSHSRRTGHEER
jgi:hypothetical protein